MKSVPPHIQKGRKLLRIFIFAGLLVPLIISLYHVAEYIKIEFIAPPSSQHFNISGMYASLAFISLIPFGIGIFLGVQMLQGKRWANLIWSIFGALIGISTSMISIWRIMEQEYSAIMFFFLGLYILAISYSCIYNPKIEAFFDYKNKPQLDDLISEIGTQ